MERKELNSYSEPDNSQALNFYSHQIETNSWLWDRPEVIFDQVSLAQKIYSE